MIVVSTVLMLIGLFFLVVSAVGLERLPEVYTRAHAVAKSETLGLMLVLGGLFFRPELDLGGAVRLVFILLFSVVANPTAVHALVRAARRAGVQPWKVGSEASPDVGLVDDRDGADPGGSRRPRTGGHGGALDGPDGEARA
jgi:multicomponent Na+:H+ antiporter subunit G